MYEDTEEEIELLKQQLELVKRQDRILEDIEIKLHEMKRIAQYASDNKLSKDEHKQLNKQILDHQTAIQSLKEYLSN